MTPLARRIGRAVAVALLAVGPAAAAAAAPLLAVGPAAAAAAAPPVEPPPPNARLDYQIGGPYSPAPGVRIVVRDRLADPVPGAYDVCYVNAFQTQPADARWWRSRQRDLLLQRNGRLLVDPDWPDEHILDISTDAKRRALIAVVGPWLDRCAADGFDAVEPDNLDTWTRSRGLLRRAHAVAFARLLAARAHGAGLAIAQKNAVELAPRGRAIGFDFAIAEECHVYRECGGYVRAYGPRVYEIEYPDNGGIGNFRAACRSHGDRISITYRDRDVSPRGNRGYVSRWC